MFKYVRNLVMLSATVFIALAESNINTMCLGVLDEIELPDELKNRDF